MMSSSACMCASAVECSWLLDSACNAVNTATWSKLPRELGSAGGHLSPVGGGAALAAAPMTVVAGANGCPSRTSGTCDAKLRSSKPACLPKSTAKALNWWMLRKPSFQLLGCSLTLIGAATTR